MFIIIDKNIKKIKQTLSANYGIEVNEENELLQEVSTDFIDKYNTSYEYELVFDAEGNVADVNIIKTLEQYNLEQQSNPEIVEETVDEEKVAMAEDIISLTMELEEIKTQIGGMK